MDSNKLRDFSAPVRALQFHLQLAFSNIKTNCSTLQANTKHAIDIAVAHFNPNSFNPKTPVWARISSNNSYAEPVTRSTAIRPSKSIEDRLGGVPVYALSNSNEEFVLVTGTSGGKSLGLLCFKKEDAVTLLEKMKKMDPEMRRAGPKVVAVSLGKVCQLKVNGVAFRLIPDSTQIKNALQERGKIGLSSDDFSGVPVFQSRSLVLRSENKSYRPVFFKKEDLDRSLGRASQQQRKLNPGLKQGDIEVAVFEEIIEGMKEGDGGSGGGGGSLKWDDVVFIPPGVDVSTV